MTPVIALGLGALGGALVALVVSAFFARRARAALVARVITSVRPALERRAVALGLGSDTGPRVDLGHDGELEISGGGNELATLLALAEAIEQREQAQLGYLDTIRVSRDEVDANLVKKTGERLKGR